MNKRTCGIIIGMVAGDGYVQSRRRTNKKGYSWLNNYLRVLHGVQQKEYCEYKCQLLNNLLKRSVKVTKIKNGKQGKFIAYHFCISHKYFRLIRKWFYPNGEKRFTEKVLNKMTDEGLAIWYMDDGHARRNYNKKGMISSVSSEIATCVTEQEALIIQKWFFDKYGLNAKIFRARQFYSIRFNTEMSKKFVDIIKPYIIPSMQYKISHVDSVISQECHAPVDKCSKCGKPIYAKRRKGLCDTCYSYQYYHNVRKYRNKAAGDDIVRAA